jgi:hypothetical protein
VGGGGGRKASEIQLPKITKEKLATKRGKEGEPLKGFCFLASSVDTIRWWRLTQITFASRQRR